MEIKVFQEKYRDGVRKICFDTANKKYQDNEADLYLMYCDYYLNNEASNCFVAVNDTDQVVGYILCAANYKKYIKIIKKDYLKKIQNRSLRKEMKIGLAVAKLMSNRYPAHMHIDIREHWRRMGVGSLLLKALETNLKESSIVGLNLSCGHDNKPARKFYEKNGFKLVLDSKSGTIYGKELK